MQRVRECAPLLKNLISSCLLAAGGLMMSPAQARVSADTNWRIFRLDGGGLTYALGVDEDDELKTIYGGGTVADSDAVGNVTAQKRITAYKGTRITILSGALYRLQRPASGATRTTNLYVSADRTQPVLFVMQMAPTMRNQQPPIQLRGLEADKIYRVRMRDNSAPLPQSLPGSASGSWWMQNGTALSIKGNLVGTALVFERAQ